MHPLFGLNVTSLIKPHLFQAGYGYGDHSGDNMVMYSSFVKCSYMRTRSYASYDVSCYTSSIVLYDKFRVNRRRHVWPQLDSDGPEWRQALDGSHRATALTTWLRRTTGRIA